MTPLLLRAAGLAVVCATALQCQTGFHLHNGDRVVFYGDSITDQRLYTTFVETFVVTRYPDLEVAFIHSGWGGDRVSGGGGGPIDTRIERDVLAYRPTVMTIMLGMNDGRYRAFDDAIFQEYSSGYEKIVRAVKGAVPSIRITAIRPSPYDDITRPPTFPGGYNAVLVRYGDYLADLARREGMSVADLNAGVVAALDKANAAEHETALKLLPDRVHPGPAGHLLMAGELLKAWKASAIVSSVAIDGATGRVERTLGTRISEFRAGRVLAWTQVDEALPMPVDSKDAATALALRSSDFTETLNQQTLRVSGLAGGDWTLRIDGETVGSFSAEQLGTGLNLSLLPTPMARQAAAVHQLTLKHNNVHAARWRQIQVPLAETRAPHWSRSMDALDELEADLVAQQRAAARPVPRRYELGRP